MPNCIMLDLGTTYQRITQWLCNLDLPSNNEKDGFYYQKNYNKLPENIYYQDRDDILKKVENNMMNIINGNNIYQYQLTQAKQGKYKYPDSEAPRNRFQLMTATFNFINDNCPSLLGWSWLRPQVEYHYKSKEFKIIYWQKYPHQNAFDALRLVWLLDFIDHHLLSASPPEIIIVSGNLIQEFYRKELSDIFRLWDFIEQKTKSKIIVQYSQGKFNYDNRLDAYEYGDIYTYVQKEAMTSSLQLTNVYPQGNFSQEVKNHYQGSLHRVALHYASTKQQELVADVIEQFNEFISKHNCLELYAPILEIFAKEREQKLKINLDNKKIASQYIQIKFTPEGEVISTYKPEDVSSGEEQPIIFNNWTMLKRYLFLLLHCLSIHDFSEKTILVDSWCLPEQQDNLITLQKLIRKTLNIHLIPTESFQK